MRDVADQDLRFETLKTIGEVRSLYMQLWLLHRQKGLYETSAGEAERIAGLVNKASGAGQVAPAAAALFRGDAARLRAEIIALDAQLAESEALLSKEIGREVASNRLSPPTLARIPSANDALRRFAENRPTLRNVLKAELRAAENRVALAEQDSGFAFAPRLFFAREDDGAEQSVGAGLALTIPLWDTNEAEQVRARGEVRAVSGKLANVTLIGTGSLDRFHQSALRQQQRVEAYTRSVLPAFRQGYERSRRAFEAGQVPPLELWQVRERLHQAEEAALKAEAEAFRARTQLEIEIGGFLEEAGS